MVLERACISHSSGRQTQQKNPRLKGAGQKTGEIHSSQGVNNSGGYIGHEIKSAQPRQWVVLRHCQAGNGNGLSSRATTSQGDAERRGAWSTSRAANATGTLSQCERGLVGPSPATSGWIRVSRNCRCPVSGIRIPKLYMMIMTHPNGPRHTHPRLWRHSNLAPS